MCIINFEVKVHKKLQQNAKKSHIYTFMTIFSYIVHFLAFEQLLYALCSAIIIFLLNLEEKAHKKQTYVRHGFYF